MELITQTNPVEFFWESILNEFMEASCKQRALQHKYSIYSYFRVVYTWNSIDANESTKKNWICKLACYLYLL